MTYQWETDKSLTSINDTKVINVPCCDYKIFGTFEKVGN